MLSIPTLLLGLAVAAATTKPQLVPAPAGDVKLERLLDAARTIGGSDSIDSVQEKAKSLGAPELREPSRDERSAHWMHRAKGWTYHLRVIFLRHPKHREFYPAMVGVTRIPDVKDAGDRKQEMLYFDTPNPVDVDAGGEKRG